MIHRPSLTGTFVLFVLLVASGYDPVVAAPPTKTATLVEVHALPGCAGLDCPPWPTLMSVYVCLEIDGAYFTATYLPWGVPWATSGKKLLKLEGKSIQVIVTDKHIKVVSPLFNGRLTRMHNYRMFGSSLCNAA